jgi:hypothetical protein
MSRLSDDEPTKAVGLGFGLSGIIAVAPPLTCTNQVLHDKSCYRKNEGAQFYKRRRANRRAEKGGDPRLADVSNISNINIRPGGPGF